RPPEVPPPRRLAHVRPRSGSAGAQKDARPNRRCASRFHLVRFPPPLPDADHRSELLPHRFLGRVRLREAALVPVPILCGALHRGGFPIRDPRGTGLGSLDRRRLPPRVQRGESVRSPAPVDSGGAAAWRRARRGDRRIRSPVALARAGIVRRVSRALRGWVLISTHSSARAAQQAAADSARAGPPAPPDSTRASSPAPADTSRAPVGAHVPSRVASPPPVIPAPSMGVVAPVDMIV